MLSPDESSRAARFKFKKDQVYFRRCRSALRFLLASYVAVGPQEILFEYGSHGRPQLAADQNLQALQFSVSHSGSMALIAVKQCGAIGH